MPQKSWFLMAMQLSLKPIKKGNKNCVSGNLKKKGFLNNSLINEKNYSEIRKYLEISNNTTCKHFHKLHRYLRLSSAVGVGAHGF